MKTSSGKINNALVVKQWVIGNRSEVRIFNQLYIDKDLEYDLAEDVLRRKYSVS